MSNWSARLCTRGHPHVRSVCSVQYKLQSLTTIQCLGLLQLLDSRLSMSASYLTCAPESCKKKNELNAIFKQNSTFVPSCHNDTLRDRGSETLNTVNVSSLHISRTDTQLIAHVCTRRKKKVITWTHYANYGYFAETNWIPNSSPPTAIRRPPIRAQCLIETSIFTIFTINSSLKLDSFVSDWIRGKKKGNCNRSQF